jgi:hypothetical protein
LHVLVATAEEPLQWTVFESFATHPRARVTACSTMGQCRQLCAADPPGVVILDLDLLGDEPSALTCFARLMRPDTHLIGLTGSSKDDEEANSELVGLTLLPKPVAQDSLIRLALSRPPQANPPTD